MDTSNLQGINLFKDLTEQELQLVSRAFRTQCYEEGSFLYFQEDLATHIYVLLEGRVKMTQLTPEGQQVILHFVSPGEVFGVVAVLIDTTFPASAQVVEDSLVAIWDKSSMYDLMIRIPRIAINALSILAEHTRHFQDRIRELSTERVERRIARTLLRLARETGRRVEAGVLLDLSLSRQDLAEMTGTTLFTVSRTLSQWEAKGILKSGREQVIILYPHGLVEIAEDLPSESKR